ncbi:helix-turn-helix domain-containing protein [Thorsellia anophelis]|uniref:Helix-turn-helix domain-containing protein n=1 Tax=Thorsellia anophelis DSM 18579 TaxID=1123402 RepID=A0A1H9ZR94_9GAMM|nr:helix-turn-helix domain-containing protein [Thorsellia anophelis]SES83693.1 Helix-turn-helix domain-containing protein [Thorsellia anophelis DSM 18579]
MKTQRYNAKRRNKADGYTMSYNHLSLQERHYINTSLKKGMSLSQIARDFERSQSTISREVNRNKDKHKLVKLTAEITKKIDKYLRREWGPEQIVGRLASDGIIKLDHETVYQYILADKKAGGDLYTHLRHQGKTYRKHYGTVWYTE